MSQTYPVYDPATLEVVGHAPDLSAEDVDRAVARARGAARSWAGDRNTRRECLLRCAAAVRERAGELGELLSREQGKPVREATGEFQVGASLLEYYARLEWPLQEPLPDRADRSVTVHNLPVGVVGTITPWNYPISLLLVKLAPALVAGCTVISKPAPTTPLSTIALIDLMNEILPEGVLQHATSRRRTVNVALSEHPQVRKLSFTGSTEVGTAIMAQAAATVKRVTAELGGNDPAVVLEDADVEFTARSIAASAFRNAGQVCMAAKRVYVPRKLESAMVEGLAEAADRLVVGHGMDGATTMGPMHNASQLATVTSLVERATAHGAHVVTGGRHVTDLPGYFLAPTVVSGAPQGCALVNEEQFGAALPVVVYDDVAQLTESLNQQPRGLGASVWSPDLERATEVAGMIEAGTVWINQHTLVEPDAPFGGWRLSGVGRERGRWGLEHYLEQRVINARPHAQAHA